MDAPYSIAEGMDKEKPALEKMCAMYYNERIMFNKKWGRAVKLFWIITGILVIISMTILYSAPAFF